ncbi:winged helix-turn-helix domain-containing protein [Rhodovulum sp. ES.010]|uniref:winged helix-turn-helix domain-containing protein n=1 Tax=Rhodovulum sp. ES.010 TaxID=1882821 RepID=UPI000A45E8C0|nr:winged helix-turn-helix domain-containing protein [Rhodovulum sp. ES.010]
MEAPVEARGRLLSKAQLEEHLYCFDDLIERNMIELHVSRLRKKLGRDGVATERGHGYRLGKG